MTKFDAYPFSFEEISQRIAKIESEVNHFTASREIFSKILSFVDLTSLEGSDTNSKILSVCEKAKKLQTLGSDIPGVAAVCFYPPFVRLAKKELASTGIHVASVAGAFPSGQSPISAKIEEVKYAIGEGADEIDTVISRGKFLEGEHTFVFDEISAIKEACGDAHLKVILETGELHSAEHIRKASEIAILAGADFIKTSTGKVQPAATLEAFLIMADTVREYHQKTGKYIGIKPAGGISTAAQALQYLNVLYSILSNDWINNKLFRIGASRLTDDLVSGLRQ